MDNQSDSATVRFAVNDAHSIAFSNRVWSLTDAQANLPEVLRLGRGGRSSVHRSGWHFCGDAV